MITGLMQRTYGSDMLVYLIGQKEFTTGLDYYIEVKDGSSFPDASFSFAKMQYDFKQPVRHWPKRIYLQIPRAGLSGRISG